MNLDLIFTTNFGIWHWFGLAVLLVIVELTLGASFFLLWLGLSAAIVGAILWVFPTLGWEYQLLIFAIESLAVIAFWHFHLKHVVTKTDKPRLNRRAEQYIGRTFTIESAIINGVGKIHVDDSSWRVVGDDMPKGSKVKVTDVDGVILKVEKIS